MLSLPCAVASCSCRQKAYADNRCRRSPSLGMRCSCHVLPSAVGCCRRGGSTEALQTTVWIAGPAAFFQTHAQGARLTGGALRLAGPGGLKANPNSAKPRGLDAHSGLHGPAGPMGPKRLPATFSPAAPQGSSAESSPPGLGGLVATSTPAAPWGCLARPSRSSDIKTMDTL